MKTSTTLLLVAVAAFATFSITWAHGPAHPPAKGRLHRTTHFVESCVTAKAQIDMDINNVRARLLTGGDIWWDRFDGKYVVPKPLPGQPEVSAIYAAGIWMGGYDSGGSLKVACQSYGNSAGNSDYWPGPLTSDEGITTGDVCNNWDRLFEVKGTDIKTHINNYQMAAAGGPAYTADQIPQSVKNWPGRGNPYFFQYYNFHLPNGDESLAPFFDNDNNDRYEPLKGDFPVLELNDCNAYSPQVPDQMVFWIYNDEGGGAIHGETNGTSIHMEIQATAFAYSTHDQLNDMTFQQHKFINRAKEDIDNFHFALWVDPDLGCHADDYLGCNPERNLSYWYNADAEDGQVGTTCDGGLATYGTNIPALGIDIFESPSDENGKELGMSSFTYYFTVGISLPSGIDPPANDVEFYRYLTGSWKDGTPLTYGGIGYDNGGGEITKFAFPSLPNDTTGWSMCHIGPAFPGGFPTRDVHFVQSCGPMLLQPGATNKLTFGVMYAPDLEYPCPDLNKLLIADDVAEAFFNNCMHFEESPDAPDVDWVALDREIIGVLSNKAPVSNNAEEAFEEVAIGYPTGVADSTYNFEGYLVYQLAGPNVRLTDLDDPMKARLAFQTDVKNGASKLVNWETAPNPTYDPSSGTGNYFVYQPTEVIEGSDQGIQHSFRIREDLFAQGDRRLLNHRKYYFVVLAYAANNYQTFNPLTGIGQKKMFLLSRNNIGPNNDGLPYTVVPRPIVDQKLNASYGEGPTITRLDGEGLGGNFVDVADETLTKILDGSFDGEIVYQPGRAPITVQVFNPLQTVGGEYEISFVDEDMTNESLDPPTHWQLRNLTTNEGPFESDFDISRLNEQLFGQFGFSVTLGQTQEVGECNNENHGVIGAELEYADPTALPWFGAIPHNFPFTSPGTDFNAVFQFLPDFFDNDCSNRPLVEMGEGYFVPYELCQFRQRPDEVYLSPAWRSGTNSIVVSAMSTARLNNVDIVFTPNKDHWSRCVVVETRNEDFNNVAYNEFDQIARGEGDARQFDLRKSPSVGKTDNDGDGLPDPDGDGIGMGWFPGYAVDVETGQRLNLFFGENSAFSLANGYHSSYIGGRPNGADMVFNPTSQLLLDGASSEDLMHYFAGGQHFIYVTNEPYDECSYLRSRFDPTSGITKKVAGLQKITWTAMTLLPTGARLLSYADGLIPNELHVKLRVDNPFGVATGTGVSNGYPTYRFKMDALASQPLQAHELHQALANINIVPNPYYAFSDYENGPDDKLVKITNLPARCEVTIFSLDGRHIRTYQRDELPGLPNGSAVAQAQVTPDLEWDLKNTAGIPISPGVYLVHVKAPGIGERTLKWFGVTRDLQFGN